MSGDVSIPVISMATATGADLVRGLQQSSCVLLDDLGPVAGQAHAAVAESRAFFDLPEQEKRRIQWSGEGEWAGWQPLYEAGTEGLALERFELALPDPAGFESDDEWTATFDQWPAQPSSLRPVWATYYRSMRALTNRVVELLAEGLQRPDADLEAWTAAQHSNLCVNHYLAPGEGLDPDLVRQKPHADIGGVTLLWTDGRPGLEAQIAPDGGWQAVTVPPDKLLLQAGELLHLWSAGSIPANRHRVANPPTGPGIAPTDRYSLVFFHHPDLDTWVAAPDSSDAAVVARDHVMERQRRSYSAA
jgi:isopenicillin N synthase-like dioxygenase